MRKSDFFFAYILGVLVLIAMAFAHASLKKQADMRRLADETEMVSRLAITDLCLFTEAGYTRHVSQADFHAPFQDSPMTLDHFPSGSFVIPPCRKGAPHANLD